MKALNVVRRRLATRLRPKTGDMAAHIPLRRKTAFLSTTTCQAQGTV